MSHHHKKHTIDGSNDGGNVAPEPNNTKPVQQTDVQVAEGAVLATEPAMPTIEQTAPLENQPIIGKPLKNKKKLRLIIGIVAAVLVLVLGTASALVYALWYQNPERVVLDAVVHAIKADAVQVTGEFSLKNSGEDNSSGIKSAKLKITEKSNIATYDMNAELAVDIDSDYYSGSIILKSSVIVSEEGDIYVKADGINEAIDVYMKSFKQTASEYFSEEQVEAHITTYREPLEKFTDKIDGQWWKISVKELSKDNEEYANIQECVMKVAKKLETDSNMRAEVASVYGDHKFITIKKELGEKDGNYGFEIEGDSKEANKFIKGLKKTSVYKELNKCNELFEIDDDLDYEDSKSAVESTFKVTVEMWVSKLAHEIVEIKVKGSHKSDVYQDFSSEYSATFKPIFNQKSEIKAPSGAKSITTGTDYDSLSSHQRDTQRKNDLSRVQAAINLHQSNNRGKLPEPGGLGVFSSCTAASSGSFAANYLLVAGDSFCDPDGSVYIFNDISSPSEYHAPATFNHMVYFVRGAKCAGDGETVIATSGNNKISIIYRLENNSIYCLNN
ncbi:MAG: hypothetical protein LBH36_00960 [Candidatus Nomurabacteria bacterium]|jgi:hypothetical protein|nr:hypothetical protein [Candidatus Nomurabacteria bacterium]